VALRLPAASIAILLATWIGCSSGGGKPPGPGAAGNGGATATGGRAGAAGGVAGAGPGAGGASMLGGRGGAPQAWTCAPAAYGDGRCDCGCGAPDSDCAQQDLAHCQVCSGAGSCNLADCPGRIDPADVTACLAPPAGWTCTPSTYGDGHQCECGCGLPDPDCKTADVTSCDNCLAVGSCAKTLCPSTIAPGDNAHCAAPPLWTCSPGLYGDGVCNCGCGVVDIDCPDATAASCQLCDQSSCAPFQCAAVDPNDNAHCTGLPVLWQCSPRLYGDGHRCDCGCGAFDPDCASLGPDACDTCNDPGSCSAQACPGLIDPTNNAHCVIPPTPAGWGCVPGTYGDGTCDCGCSVPDIDCRSSDPSYCARCLACGGIGVCAGSIDPSDSTQCAPPPAGWTCSAAAYRNISCDCGCGIPDPECQGIPALYVCEHFPVEGCSGGIKSHVNPGQNSLCLVSVPAGWTCDRSYFDDGICDCGCGAVDLDCPSNDVADCWQCNGTGSCSTAACPGTIAPGDTAHCSN